MRKIFDLLDVLLEETTEGAFLFLPDVHILSNVKGALNIGSEEGILPCNFVTVVHNGHVLCVAKIVLSEHCVLELPSGSVGKFGKFPPVIESLIEVSWNLSGLHDNSLKGVELFLGDALVHLDEAC